MASSKKYKVKESIIFLKLQPDVHLKFFFFIHAHSSIARKIDIIQTTWNVKEMPKVTFYDAFLFDGDLMWFLKHENNDGKIWIKQITEFIYVWLSSGLQDGFYSNSPHVSSASRKTCHKDFLMIFMMSTDPTSDLCKEGLDSRNRLEMVNGHEKFPQASIYFIILYYNVIILTINTKFKAG